MPLTLAAALEPGWFSAPAGAQLSPLPLTCRGLPGRTRYSRPWSWSPNETTDVPASRFPPNRCSSGCFACFCRSVCRAALPSCPSSRPTEAFRCSGCVLRKPSTPSQSWGHSPGRRSCHCPSRRLQRAGPPSDQFQLASCPEPPENPSCHPGPLPTYDTTSLNSSEGSLVTPTLPFPMPSHSGWD